MPLDEHGILFTRYAIINLIASVRKGLTLLTLCGPHDKIMFCFFTDYPNPQANTERYSVFFSMASHSFTKRLIGFES